MLPGTRARAAQKPRMIQVPDYRYYKMKEVLRENRWISTENDGLWTAIDGFELKMMDFVLNMMDVVLKMMDFVLKMMDFVGEGGGCSRGGG